MWEYPTWRPRLRWRRRVTCVALPTRGSTPGNSSSTDYIGCKTPTTINTLLGNYSYSHARGDKLNKEEAIPSPYPPLSLSLSQGCICQISLGGSKFWLLKSTTVLMHRYIGTYALVGGVAQWQNVGLWPANFPCPALDLQLMGDH